VERPEGALPAVFSTDADGSRPELLCAAGAGHCPFGGAFSADGGRIAYVTTDRADSSRSTIAVMDLATRDVTTLDSTRSSSAVTQCDAAGTAGLNGSPEWSPDGSRLIFARTFFGTIDDGGCRKGALFVINADGTDLRQLTPSEMLAFGPHWSPDGTTVLFSGDERRPSAALWATDLYTIRPDGDDMRRLTSDGGSLSPHWTSDGRIVFLRLVTGGFDEVRLVEPDGSGEMQVDHADIVALTGLGCRICPYAPAVPRELPVSGHWDAYWQPLTEDQR